MPLTFMKSRLSLFIAFFLLLAAWGCRIHNNPPELTGRTPDKAEVGKEITLSGYQFGPDPTVTVGIGATAVTATLKAKDDNSIRAIVPVVPPGLTQIRVRTDQGTSDPLPFEVLQPAPTLTTISPGNGLPGTAVVLTGTYLNQLKRVVFRDTPAVVKDSSLQKLTVIVPANLPHGPVTLYVETAGGTMSGSFIVAGTPQITSVSPKVVRPNGELIIQGVNLSDATVRINDQSMDRTKTIIKDTEIRTIVPEFAKSGPITVTVFDKLIAVSADTVKVVQPPFITNLGARDGVAGDKLILSGLNFLDVTSVTVGTLPAQFRILGDGQIEAIVPKLPAPGPVGVSVSGPGGNHTAADPFFYYPAPGAITVTPTRQLRSRGITISGQNLYRITDVLINEQSVPINDRVEGSQVFVNVPDNATSGPVRVVNRAGSSTSPVSLTVVQKPLITDIVPAKAKPGDRVVLKGNFLLNAQVFFSGTSTPAADGGKNDDLERWVLVPNSAQSGPIRVVNAAGETTTNPFTILRVASTTDFNPKTGKAGDTVFLIGQNVASVQEIRFGSGSSSAAKFVLDNTGQLIITVPADATTGTICLTNEAGTACTSASFTVVK